MLRRPFVEPPFIVAVARELLNSAAPTRRPKIMAYLAYYDSGKYKARYGATGLRILTVTTSEARREDLKAITEAAGIRSRFWFTTQAEISATSVLSKQIWRVATSAARHVLIDSIRNPSDEGVFP